MNDLEILNQCFEPDFESGILYFKERPRDHFLSDKSYNIWNNKWVGEISGSTCVALKDGAPRYYQEIRVSIQGKLFRRYLHRCIYMMYHNVILDSSQLIDHIDGNGKNNSIHNIRLCTRQENAWNSKQKVNSNMSGHKNVYYEDSPKRKSKWRVTITKDGKSKSYGYYPTVEEAVEVAKEKRLELFGEFANNGE